MTRRFRLGIALAALAMHLLASVGAYAAVRPAAAFGDYCSAARSTAPAGEGARAQQRAAASDSGRFAPQQRHGHLHTHCASCLGASLAAAIPPPSRFAVRQLARSIVMPPGAVRTRAASAPVLLPPLRGPPPTAA